MKSTSIHSLNSDAGLNRSGRYRWYLMNWVNNHCFPNAGSTGLAIRHFAADVSDENWGKTSLKSSPSRKLCDLFWLQLPWAKIKKELGSINVFDTGCGSGNYGLRLDSCSNAGIDSYTGVDVSRHDNWRVLAQARPAFRFHQLGNSDISRHIPGDANFFITQSAIEHFENDLLFFEQVRGFVERASRSIVQVHLFPSRACLKLYSCHGVRQYTPRTISSIERLFRGFSYSLLYELGGKECNRVHWEFITKPSLEKTGDRRDTQTQEYDQRLRQAIRTDNSSPRREPSFYALVIHSHWKEIVFT